jgi:hypothetical protein
MTMAKGYLDYLAEAWHAAGHFVMADALGFQTDESITADWCPRFDWEQYTETEQRGRFLHCVQVYLAGMVAEFIRLDLDGDERQVKRNHDDRIRKDLDAATTVLQAEWDTEAIARLLSEQEQEAARVIQSRWAAVHRMARLLYRGEMSARFAAELIRPPGDPIQAAQEAAGNFPTDYRLIATAWMNSEPEAVKEAIKQHDQLQPLIAAAPDADLPSILGPACFLTVNRSADELGVLQRAVFDSLGKVANLTLPYETNWNFIDPYGKAFTVVGDVRDAAKRAEAELLDLGLKVDKKTGRLKQANPGKKPGFWFNRLVEELYDHFLPQYLDEWGRKRNKKEIRNDISDILRPAFAPDMIDPNILQPIHRAIDNLIKDDEEAT